MRPAEEEGKKRNKKVSLSLSNHRHENTYQFREAGEGEEKDFISLLPSSSCGIEGIFWEAEGTKEEDCGTPLALKNSIGFQFHSMDEEFCHSRFFAFDSSIP